MRAGSKTLVWMLGLSAIQGTTRRSHSPQAALVVLVYSATPCLPVRGGRVSVDGGRWASMTDTLGIARFAYITPGRHVVEAFDVGQGKSISIQLEADESRDVVIDMSEERKN